MKEDKVLLCKRAINWERKMDLAVWFYGNGRIHRARSKTEAKEEANLELVSICSTELIVFLR